MKLNTNSEFYLSINDSLDEADLVPCPADIVGCSHAWAELFKSPVSHMGNCMICALIAFRCVRIYLDTWLLE